MMKRINKARRWLARLVLTNYIAIFVYLLFVGSLEPYAAFIIALMLLGYNYFVVRFITQLPKGHLHWVRDKYLLIPAITSAGIACMIVVIELFWR